MAKETDTLSTLNDRELGVLRLLSAGHTAKSIAASTGMTVNAVNDRLRDARRKTGVGSSRELARLVVTQENWTENIGLSPDRDGDQDEQDVRPPLGKPNRRKGKVVALIIASLVTIVAIWGYRQGVVRPFRDDAREGALRAIEAHVGGNRRSLAAALEAETRDPDWASRTEALLRSAYMPVLMRQSVSADLHVRCARTICEVLATYNAVLSQPREASLKGALVPAAFPALADAGLANRGVTISNRTGAGPKLLILAYWQGPPRP